MQSFDAVRAAFTDPEEFWSSPLYRQLSGVVAGEPYLVELAAHTRDGQVPTFAFFGAVHALLLAGVEHPLADYYPSLRGDGALPLAGAGPALLSFARRFESDIVDIVSTRLVQTNHVRRAVGLRLALAAIAPSVGSRPAHLLEVGSSAGLLMRHAHYGYCLGGRQFGDRASPVQLVTDGAVCSRHRILTPFRSSRRRAASTCTRSTRRSTLTEGGSRRSSGRRTATRQPCYTTR